MCSNQICFQLEGSLREKQNEIIDLGFFDKTANS